MSVRPQGSLTAGSPRDSWPAPPTWPWRSSPPSTTRRTCSNGSGTGSRGGARLVWLIAPEAKTATVYRPDGSARLLRESEALDGEDVLPGLAIPLADVLP